MRTSLSLVFVSTFLMVMIFGSAYTDAMAQVASPDPVLSEQTLEGEACGPKVQLPEGSQVVREEGSLLVTLPPNYEYVAHNGVVSFRYKSLLSTLGESGPSLSFLLEEAVPINCQCTGGVGEETCTEVYDIKREQIFCRTLNGCDDCHMCVGSCS